MTCVICDHRPAVANGLCHNCGQKVTALDRGRQKPKPWRYVCYRGNVIAMYRNGDGTLRSELSERDPAKLQKAITLDLDGYVSGLERGAVKRFGAQMP